MTEICAAAIHLCRIRITRLTELGAPAPGPNNSYVTDNPVMLSVKPVIEAGADKTLVGGCDCITVSYRGSDKLKRFDLELDLSKLEPGMQEMMLGASVILHDVGGDAKGLWWPDQLSCSSAKQPNVCIEGWQDSWEDDHQSNSPFQYVRWVWPSSRWQIGDFTLQNDFNQPKLVGYTRSNPLWGLGIYGDMPEAAGPLGGYFFTDKIPSAFCGYQSHVIT